MKIKLLFAFVVIALTAACSRVQLASKADEEFKAPEKIEKVYVYLRNQPIPEEAHLIGEYHYAENTNTDWINMNTKLRMFARSHGGNLYHADTIGMGGENHSMYIGGNFYYMNSEALKKHYNEINSVPEDQARMVIYRIGHDNLLQQLLPLTLQIEGKDYGKFGTLDLAEYTVYNKDIVLVSINRGSEIELPVKKGTTSYYVLKRDSGNKVTSNSILLSTGGVNIYDVDCNQGKLMVQKIKDLNKSVLDMPVNPK